MVDGLPPKCAGVLPSLRLKPAEDLTQSILLQSTKRFFQLANWWTAVPGFGHQPPVCRFEGVVHPNGHPIPEDTSSKESPRIGQSLSNSKKLISRD